MQSSNSIICQCRMMNVSTSTSLTSIAWHPKSMVMEMVRSGTSSISDFQTESRTRSPMLGNPLPSLACEPKRSLLTHVTGNAKQNSVVRPPPAHLHPRLRSPSPLTSPHPPPTLMTPPPSLIPQTHTPYLPLTPTPTPPMIPPPRILTHLPLAQTASPLMPSPSPPYRTLDGHCCPLCAAWVPAQRYHCELHSFSLRLSCVSMAHPPLPSYPRSLSCASMVLHLSPLVSSTNSGSSSLPPPNQ